MFFRAWFRRCCPRWLFIRRNNLVGRETIADNLKKAGWSLGWVSAIDCDGRTIWIADAHCNGKPFIVRADEKLTAFLELQAAIREVPRCSLGRTMPVRPHPTFFS